MGFPYFQCERALRLSDEDYYVFLLDKIRNSSKSIYATIFIIDVFHDRWGKIKRILDEIAYAKWRGVDVKIVIGHSNKSLSIDVPDRMSFRYLRDRGIPIKFSNPPDDYSLHSKYVIFDDNLVVAGSHNWAHLDIFMSKEDSVAVYSKDVAINFIDEFEKLWNTGLEELE